MLPEDWDELLSGETREPYWAELMTFVDSEREQHEVYPPPEQMFAALKLTPYANVCVVILGQDPYHGPGEAHGLCFSVPDGIPKPPSLRTIDKELQSDLGITPPDHGNLEAWARQGVLLLNTTLTVQRDDKAGSHRGHGWEEFTDEVIRVVNEKPERVVFVLWGDDARRKRRLIDTSRHAVVESAHPAARANALDPFRTSRPFSRTNRLLEESGLTPINWAR